MKRKDKYIDRLEMIGSVEDQKKVALKRLEKLKSGDLSFMGYGIKKENLKTKISKWLKKIKRKLNKVQISQK